MTVRISPAPVGVTRPLRGELLACPSEPGWMAAVLSDLLSVLLLVGTVWLAAIAFNVYAVNLWLTGLHFYAT